VILPPGGGGKGLPLIVLAPGGSRRGPNEFDWLAQYLAASGYAVLRPDTALAPLPTEGGGIWWGGVSQRYAVDGVNELVRQGIADPRRVCIVGAGYGGYAALSGVAFFPGTFACAVSIDGISDLPSLLAHEKEVFGGSDSNHVALAWWDASVGSQSDPKLITESPVHAAQAITASVLLIHGNEDSVVPLEQSLEMKRAMEKAGKRVTFMGLEGSDHSLDRASTRIEVLKAVGGFLRASLQISQGT
jgi:dipeptidyl aminopeptidase/acylaminoacyl peptidase